MAGINSWDVFFKRINVILFGGFNKVNGKDVNTRNKKTEIEVINNLYMKYHDSPSDANYENLKLKIIKLYSSVIDIFLRADIKTIKLYDTAKIKELPDEAYIENEEDNENRTCGDCMADSASDLFYTVAELLKKEKTIKNFNPKKFNTFFNYFHFVIIKRNFITYSVRENLTSNKGGIKISRSDEILVKRVKNIVEDLEIKNNYSNLNQTELEIILNELQNTYNEYKNLKPITLQRKLLEHFSTTVSINSPINDSEDEITIGDSILNKEHQYNYNEKIEACLDEAINLLRTCLKAEKAENYLSNAVFNVICDIVRICADSIKISYQEVFNAQKESYREIIHKYTPNEEIINFIEIFINENGKLPKEADLAKHLKVKQYDINRLKKVVSELNLHICADSAKISYQEVFNAQKESYREMIHKYTLKEDIINFIENFINENGKLPKEGDLAKHLKVEQYDISRLKKVVSKLNLRNKINTALTDYNYTHC